MKCPYCDKELPEGIKWVIEGQIPEESDLRITWNLGETKEKSAEHLKDEPLFTLKWAKEILDLAIKEKEVSGMSKEKEPET